MFYQSIEDLPYVCRIHLPEDALQVYREAFNRSFAKGAAHDDAQKQAWVEVRKRFVKDGLTGRWLPRTHNETLHSARR